MMRRGRAEQFGRRLNEAAQKIATDMNLSSEEAEAIYIEVSVSIEDTHCIDINIVRDIEQANTEEEDR